MRIIGGNFKGKKIFDAFDKNTRPLKDLIKESIFNILEHSKNEKIKIDSAIVLDLFSGTGSFGLECISRGASKVYFFENYSESIQVLNKNIDRLKCHEKIKLINDSAFNFYKYAEINSTKFDLIFLDPPYKEKDIQSILENIIKNNILRKNGIIVMHRHKKSNDEYAKKFKLIRTEKYGISKILFGNII